MLIAAIMQPTYLPWIGYFDLIDIVDKFVFLDNVQVVKRYWDVRNRIKTAKGELYLTVPLKKIKSRDETIFCEAVIDREQLWQKNHLKSIQFNYRKAKFFDMIYPFVETLINNQEIILSRFNIFIIESIAKLMGIKQKFILASNLNNISGKKDNLLVSICKAIGCDGYLSPKGASAYIEKKSPGGAFAKNNIKLIYQNYQHPLYNQLYGSFIPYLSIVDLLFNEGNEALSIIRSGREGY